MDTPLRSISFEAVSRVSRWNLKHGEQTSEVRVEVRSNEQELRCSTYLDCLEVQVMDMVPRNSLQALRPQELLVSYGGCWRRVKGAGLI